MSTYATEPTLFDERPNRPAQGAVWGENPHEKMPLVELVANRHRFGQYRFVPLIRSNWALSCRLEILFLRHDPPGNVYTAGDLDNRIKTVVDALQMPQHEVELRGNETPAEDEDPFFCLLENDMLVSAIQVESDRLLKPSRGNTDSDRSEAHVVITIDAKPFDVNMFNLSFV